LIIGLDRIKIVHSAQRGAFRLYEFLNLDYTKSILPRQRKARPEEKIGFSHNIEGA
jgi:hypothetical protein